MFGYKNKEKYPGYVSKKCFEEKHADLLLIQKEDKRYYVVIKYFDTSMYDHTLHQEIKHFFGCLKASRTAEKFKCHIKDYFNINGK